jgi:cyclic 2,3-diphosphoglycerate synthase
LRRNGRRIVTDPLGLPAWDHASLTPARQNAPVPVIALIDGEHHPDAVREALARLDLAGVVFCGGEEKLGSGSLEDHYGRPVETQPEEALRRLAPGAEAVVDLADEPVLPPRAKLRLAALALHLGLRYAAPGLRLDPPRYEPVAYGGPKLAVIATGKRTGKTALACHMARLLREHDPVIVCMGRGGPKRPVVASPETSLEDLLAIADGGAHAASDYLEDAVLAGVRSVGCRRVGGGLVGEPALSNVPEGAALAAWLQPGLIVFEGSGSCIPPVEVDRTVCIVGAGEPEPLSEYRLLRSDLLLAHEGAAAPPAAIRFELRPEPAEPLPDDARVALFTTGAPSCDGVDPVVASTNLARRAALAEDLERAVEEGCDVWLTELKAAAIDTVAARARSEGVRVVFVRNRPVGDGLDEALVKLHRDAG